MCWFKKRGKILGCIHLLRQILGGGPPGQRFLTAYTKLFLFPYKNSDKGGGSKKSKKALT